MKKFLKSIIALLIQLWSRIYTYDFSQSISMRVGTIYSYWISQFLGEVGENTEFGRPMSLQGGGQKRIKVGANTHIGHHAVLGCWVQYGANNYEPEIFIGNNCSIGEYCHITALNRITIGDGLLTGRFVYIGDNAHGGLSKEEAGIPPIQRPLNSKGEIKIGRNVWIGDKVSIFGGVTIGNNVIIGAGSIVTHNVPSNCMVAGIPAKIVKQLD